MVSYKLTAEPRADLYYKKYKYRAKFNIVGVDRTRCLNTISEYKLRLNQDIRFYKKQRWPDKRLESIDLDKIEKFLNWKHQLKKDNNKLMFRLEFNTCVIYANDTSNFDGLNSFIDHVEFFEADISIPQGVKYFGREPKHNYRVYLKPKRVSVDFKKTLIELETRYKNTSNQLYFCDSLDKWLSLNHLGNYSYIRSNFFIEYDNESTLTLLSLMVGESFNMIYKCIKKPKV